MRLRARYAPVVLSLPGALRSKLLLGLHTVTFTHQDRATGQTKSLRLTGEEFLRRFLQHVLPTGLQRVRHFGWLSPAAKKRWQRIHALLDWKPAAPPDAAAAPCWAPQCPRCRKPMRLLGTFARSPP